MKQQIAVITGGTRGIGFSIAQALSRSHYTPVLNFHSDETRADVALAQLHASCPDAIAVRADATTSTGVQRLVETARRHGEIAVWVNNIGRFHFKPFLQTSIEEWQAILSSNLYSAVLCCQAVLPIMREQRHGQIINMASMHAERIKARPNTLPYAVAKSGVIHLTQTLAKTEGDYGIRINAICPGFIDGGTHTKAQHAEQVPLSRLGSAEDIAQAVGFLVSEGASYITGAVINIHGGALL